MFQAPFGHRIITSWARFRDRIGLSSTGLVGVASGLVALIGTLVVFGGVTEDVTRHNGLSTTDLLHLHWFTEHRTSALVSASRFVSEIGSPAVLGLAALAIALWLWMRGLRLGLAVAPGVALCVAAVGATVTKMIVDRSRPPASLHLVAESNASFPSAHATNATAFLVTAALIVAVFVIRRPFVRVLTVATAAFLAGSIGVSRLILGVHWPTDVLAGWTLGLSVALVTTIAAGFAASARRVKPSPGHATVARALRIFDARRDGPTTLHAA